MVPRFTVIMPVYNGGEFVDAAIESVRGQTFGDFELLVCDDGSSDDTIERVARHVRADDRLKLLAQGAGRGPGARRNQALAAARAPWIAFIDADDLWPAERLEWSARAIDASPDTVLFFGDYQRFARSVGDLGPAVQEQKGFFDDAAEYAQGWTMVGDDLTLLRCRSDRLLVYCCLRQCPISTHTVTLNREVLERERIRFREDWRINEDFDVWMRMLEAGASAALRRVMAFYRKNSNSLTSEPIRYLEGMAISHGEWLRRIEGRLSEPQQRVYRDKVAGFWHSAAWQHSRAGRVLEAASAQWRALAVRRSPQDALALMRTVLRALWWRGRSFFFPAAVR